MWRSEKSGEEEKVFSYTAQFNTDDLSTLAQLMASGEVKSVIDRRFPLEETAAAMAMQGSHQAAAADAGADHFLLKGGAAERLITAVFQ